ncbi:hypothetical protein D3C71_1052080 [compost metagenome]
MDRRWFRRFCLHISIVGRFVGLDDQHAFNRIYWTVDIEEIACIRCISSSDLVQRHFNVESFHNDSGYSLA